MEIWPELKVDLTHLSIKKTCGGGSGDEGGC